MNAAETQVQPQEVIGAATAAKPRLGLRAALLDELEQERARWFVWLPVLFGIGVAAYFALPDEPRPSAVVAVLLMAAGLAGATRRARLLRLVGHVVLVAALGFSISALRTEWVRAPVLAKEMRRAVVEGVVELVEPRPGRGERLTIRVTDIKGLAAAHRPARIRVRMMQKRDGLKPGAAVRLSATLRPPSMPAWPGGYDFARTAWFQGLGATGYALKPPEILAQQNSDTPLSALLRANLEQLRQAIGDRIRAAVPGETGAIAVSLITGERGGISDATNDAYRDSGIVHILSISGLHMVIMAGSVFLAVRMLLAAFPAIALRFATKKWAAVAALAGATGYLLISAPSNATLRAFLMIAIMFAAVMLDRQALAMRNVALSALAILVLMPESILDPGFQMSFAAVVSLIAAYEAISARNDEDEERGGWMRPLAFFLGGIVLSTVVASVSVAPLGAYHFHRSQQYALLTNLVAVPICNLAVMPAALATLIAMPFGIEAAPLAIMAKGIDLMTATAYWVASLPGAVAFIADIPTASFAAMIAGGLWLTLWQRRWRLMGLVAIGAGVLTAGMGERPDILIGRGGTLVAIRGTDGRLAAIGQRAANFELTRWLEHDGDARTARESLNGKKSVGRNMFACDGTGCTAMTAGLRVAVARHPAALSEDCTRADILITTTDVPRLCTSPAAIIGRRALQREGTHAIYLAKEEQQLGDQTGAGSHDGITINRNSTGRNVSHRDGTDPDATADGSRVTDTRSDQASARPHGPADMRSGTRAPPTALAALSAKPARIARIESAGQRRGNRPWTATSREWAWDTASAAHRDSIRNDRRREPAQTAGTSSAEDDQ